MKWLISLLAITILAILVYKVWKPVLTPKREVVPNEAKMYMFYTEWCGWSQKAMPEWEKLSAGPHTFGSTKVEFVKVDAEHDRETAELYEVKGYPTILLETSTGLHQYTKRPTAEGLLQFLRETLGKEPSSL